MTAKECPNCKKMFEVGKWPAQKFCSPKCRVEHWKTSNTTPPDSDKGSPVEKAIATKRNQLRSKICPNCDKYFDVTGLQHNRKYCNNACKMAYLRRNDYWGTYTTKTPPNKSRNAPQLITDDRTPTQKLMDSLEAEFFSDGR